MPIMYADWPTESWMVCESWTRSRCSCCSRATASRRLIRSYLETRLTTQVMAYSATIRWNSCFSSFASKSIPAPTVKLKTMYTTATSIAQAQLNLIDVNTTANMPSATR